MVGKGGWKRWTPRAILRVPFKELSTSARALAGFYLFLYSLWFLMFQLDLTGVLSDRPLLTSLLRKHLLGSVVPAQTALSLSSASVLAVPPQRSPHPAWTAALYAPPL